MTSSPAPKVSLAEALSMATGIALEDDAPPPQRTAPGDGWEEVTEGGRRRAVLVAVGADDLGSASPPGASPVSSGRVCGQCKDGSHRLRPLEWKR